MVRIRLRGGQLVIVFGVSVDVLMRMMSRIVRLLWMMMVWLFLVVLMMVLMVVLMSHSG